MKGTVWQRCTTCSRKVNGAAARKRHSDSDCPGTRATWAYRATLGSRPDGRRDQQVRGGFDTREDAERELRGLLSKADHGQRVEDDGVTVGTFLREEWFPAMRPKVAPTTASKRERHLRYVCPRIGDVPLGKLTPLDLERLYAELRESGGRGGQPLSRSSVRDVHRTLHKAFSDAVRWQRAYRNPAATAEAPKLDKVAADHVAARQVWTAEELGRFLDATADHRLHTAFALAAHTGARRSELLALRWDAVDLERGTMTIGAAYVQQEDGTYAVRDATKSTASARTISLPPSVVALLRRHRATQAAWRLQAGWAWADTDAVLTDELGAILSPQAVSQAFRRAVRGADVPRIRLHDLRHTHATLLLQAGEPVRTVSQRLGHASAVVTMTIYSHVLPGDDRDAADRFDQLVPRAPGL